MRFQTHSCSFPPSGLRLKNRLLPPLERKSARRLTPPFSPRLVMSRPRQISSLVQATTRLSLSTTATAARPTALPLDSSLSAQRRHASWSISSLLPSFRSGNKKRSADDATPPAATSAQPGKAIKSDQPKGLFDAAVEGDEMQEIIRQGQGPVKQATFVCVKRSRL